MQKRIEFDGISVLPPQAEGWMPGADPFGEIVFKKRLPDTSGESGPYTFLAGVRHIDLNEKAPQNLQDLLIFVESSFASQNNDRFQTIDFQAQADENRTKVMHTECVAYEGIAKESDNPVFPGKILMLIARGFQCRHPHFVDSVIDVFCTERYPANTQPVNKTYQEECLTFLDMIRPGLPAERISDTDDIVYLDVPAWDYLKWQQMISATTMLSSQGNKSGAEQLCYQALQFADANMIRSLYDYANVLDTQRNDRSILVRNRADRLAQMRSQQRGATSAQVTYLGFLPERMLKEYADLLNESHRTAEAASINALGEAYRYTQGIQATRLYIINQGGNPYGICESEIK